MQMTATKRRPKADARAMRGEAARELILDAAERMFCDHGTEGVSMRQIAAAVGQGNNSAIQYHFENKEGLIHAIIERRATQFWTIRETLLNAAIAQGQTDDVKALLAVLLLPIATIKNAEGRHTYAGFIMNALQTMWNTQAQILHRKWTANGPVKETMRLLAQRRPELSEVQLGIRILRLNRMFVSALIDTDRIRQLGSKQDDEAYLLDDLLNMLAAAFLAPLPEPGGT